MTSLARAEVDGRALINGITHLPLHWRTPQ